MRFAYEIISADPWQQHTAGLNDVASCPWHDAEDANEIGCENSDSSPCGRCGACRDALATCHDLQQQGLHGVNHGNGQLDHHRESRRTANKYVDCQRCNGTGTISNNQKRTHNCPDCGGYGSMEVGHATDLAEHHLLGQRHTALTLPDKTSTTRFTTPGYYVVDKMGSPQDGPYDTYSLAIANLNGRDAIQFLDQAESPSTLQEFPPQLFTVTGAKVGDSPILVESGTKKGYAAGQINPPEYEGSKHFAYGFTLYPDEGGNNRSAVKLGPHDTEEQARRSIGDHDRTHPYSVANGTANPPKHWKMGAYKHVYTDPDGSQWTPDAECPDCKGKGCEQCLGSGKAEAELNSSGEFAGYSRNAPKFKDMYPNKEASTMHREAEILEAMRHASLREQQALMTELENIRHEATREKIAQQEIDMTRSVLERMQPVLTHSLHTAATDWLMDIEQPQTITSDIITEASLWYERTSPQVKADREEFLVQASGMARREASRHGAMRNDAYKTYMDHVDRLHQIQAVKKSATDYLLPWSQVVPPLPSMTPVGDNFNPNAPSNPGTALPLSNDAENVAPAAPQSTPEAMEQAGQVNTWMPNQDATHEPNDDGALGRQGARNLLHEWNEAHPGRGGDPIVGIPAAEDCPICGKSWPDHSSNEQNDCVGQITNANRYKQSSDRQGAKEHEHPGEKRWTSEDVRNHLRSEHEVDTDEDDPYTLNDEHRKGHGIAPVDKIRQGSVDHPQEFVPWDSQLYPSELSYDPNYNPPTPEDLARASSPANANTESLQIADYGKGQSSSDDDETPDPETERTAARGKTHDNVTLHINHRLNNSVNGNPRFNVNLHHPDGDVTNHNTSSDASCSYDVENVHRSGEPVSVDLTPAGNISVIRKRKEASAMFDYQRTSYDEYLQRVSEGSHEVREEFYPGMLAAISPTENAVTATRHYAEFPYDKDDRPDTHGATDDLTDEDYDEAGKKATEASRHYADFDDPSGKQIGNNPPGQYDPAQAYEQSGMAQSGLPLAPGEMGENFSNISNFPNTGPALVPGNRARIIQENAGADKDTDADDDSLGADRQASLRQAYGPVAGGPTNSDPREFGHNLLSRHGGREVSAGHNTTIRPSDDGGFHVRLHATDIVTHHGNGDVSFNSGGYHTTTTTARMNQWAPPGFRLNRKQGLIHVTGPDNQTRPLEDHDRFKTHSSQTTAARSNTDRNGYGQVGGGASGPAPSLNGGGSGPDRSQYARSPQGHNKEEDDQNFSSEMAMNTTDTGINNLGTVPVEGYDFNEDHPNGEMWPWVADEETPGSGAADVYSVPTPGVVSQQETGASWPQPR